MKSQRLLNAALAVVALSPLAAFADAGDEPSKQWLASLKSTRSVQEVRAEAQRLPHLSDQHPVEAAVPAESTRSRAEVRAELAKHGVRNVGA